MLWIEDFSFKSFFLVAILLLEIQTCALNEARIQSLKIIKEVWVPGSMEKPLAVKKLFLNKKIDAVAVLGIIEKGKTAHGRTMADAVLPALIELQLEFLKPIGIGILGPEITQPQIAARLEPYARKSIAAISEMLKNNYE